MRPIDADALEKKLQEQREIYINLNMLDAEHLLVHDFLRYVWEAPTINPARHGRWLEWWGHNITEYECSRCGVYSEKSENYCPNCGAKMDEEE